MDDEEDGIEVDFNFELVMSDDGKMVTLICRTDQEVTPDQYAEMLKCFVNRLSTLVEFGETAGNGLPN